jgi:glycosyltransferase involved in cell wall biosynthesis
MLNGRRVAVVLPAYNAEQTLEATVRELPDLVDIRILVDDFSSDRTVGIARRLGLKTFVHDHNYGYGRNQMTCYREALLAGADIVVMLHPDYQYTPLLVTAMASMIAYGTYDVVLGSRILGGGALSGGMPRYKYYSNRFLTAFQNVFLGAKLSEYHTGYRAFDRRVLETLPLLENSDDFVFDNQMLVQCVYFGFRIGEISCPAKYFPEASSINVMRSLKYGAGVLGTTLQHFCQLHGLGKHRIFNSDGRRLIELPDPYRLASALHEAGRSSARLDSRVRAQAHGPSPSVTDLEKPSSV